MTPTRGRALRSTRGLRATQQWFLGEIERDDPTASRRRPGADDVIAPSPTLDPAARVAIYRRMYLARLTEAMENDFPVVTAIVGHPQFHALVRRYVARHRPSSWTLNDLGRTFPSFLARRRGALVRDVARIERAMSEAFDADVTRVLRPADAALVPADAWGDARLEPSPSLRVLRLSTDANRAVTRVRSGGGVPRSRRSAPTGVAVWRREDRVWRLDLTEPMHAALSALVRGRSLAAAVAAAQRAFDGEPDVLAARVRTWFAQWIEEGFFAAVRAGASGGPLRGSDAERRAGGTR